MTFHFTTCHSYLMLHGEILFSKLYWKWGIHWKSESTSLSTFRKNLGTTFKRWKGNSPSWPNWLRDILELYQKTPVDPHIFHCNQLCLLSYINDIQVMNLGSQSGATLHREFTTRIGSPIRLLRQSFQLLGRRPNLLILRTVQEIISRNQEVIEKRNDWILFQSLTPSYFPNY